MHNEIKNLSSIQETLKKNKVKINKSLGQNFIFDLNLTDKIVKQSKPLASTIIEIGSGPGSLTRSILKSKSAIVYAIDKDVQSEKRCNYDLAVCMYHDQALIPIKTLDFHNGVNVTLGLDFIRTSPDHGTAFDIAGKNLANPESLISAINLAYEMSKNKKNA